MRLPKGAARRVLLTAAVAGVVAAAFGAVSLARAGGSSHNHVFTLTEVQQKGTFVSVSGNPQGAPGDEFIFHAALKRDGKKVGTIDAYCVLTVSPDVQCTGTFKFADGSLAASALIDQVDKTPDHISIVGGTGRYAHASGQVTSTSTGNTTSRDVFNIRY